MTNPAHILETALLLLAAYLFGCIAGYAARRILHAAQATHRVSVVATPVPVPVAEPVAAPPRRVPTPAARLAAAVADEPLPRPALADPPPKPKPRSASRTRKTPDPRPPALVAPRNGTADNLKQIKGIGPKIEASLNTLGIYHLDQIAGWSTANIDWVDSQLAFKGRIRREKWVEQATALARADAA